MTRHLSRGQCRMTGLTVICVTRNHYYNSKEGKMRDAEAAAEATAGGPVRG